MIWEVNDQAIKEFFILAKQKNTKSIYKGIPN